MYACICYVNMYRMYMYVVKYMYVCIYVCTYMYDVRMYQYVCMMYVHRSHIYLFHETTHIT